MKVCVAEQRYCRQCPKPNSERKLKINKAIGKDFVACFIFFSKTNNPRKDEVSPWDIQNVSKPVTNFPWVFPTPT
jgi:hypothetical protein